MLTSATRRPYVGFFKLNYSIANKPPSKETEINDKTKSKTDMNTDQKKSLKFERLDNILTPEEKKNIEKSGKETARLYKEFSAY